MGQKIDEKTGFKADLKYLGERFFQYKQDMNAMKQMLERHFNNLLNDVENEFPSVQVEESKNNEDENDRLEFINSSTWACFYCSTKNTKSVPYCIECRSPSPLENNETHH